jgi:heme A synthase
MSLLLDIANISGGLLLGLATLDRLDGESNFFNKIAGVLAPFQTIIGGALVVLGLLSVFRGHSVIFSIGSIIGGLLLLTHVFGKAPALEKTLRSVSDKLMPFKAIIGIALLVVGVLRLFNIL